MWRMSVRGVSLRPATPLRRPASIRSMSGDGSALRVPDDPIVQYIVVRRDLWTEQNWPLGSIIAQACHASAAALWIHRDDPLTQEYLANIDQMTKVVLEIKSLVQLNNLSAKLNEAGVAHKLWIEQPENFPTCLATRPYKKSAISSYFKKYKLCKY